MAEQHAVIAGPGARHTARVLDEPGHGVLLTERSAGTVDQVVNRRTRIVVESVATDPDILGYPALEQAHILAALAGEGTTAFPFHSENRHFMPGIQTVAQVDRATRTDTLEAFADEPTRQGQAGPEAAINRVESSTRALEDTGETHSTSGSTRGHRYPARGSRKSAFEARAGTVSDADRTDIARLETTPGLSRRYPVPAEPSVDDDIHKRLTG